MSERIRVLKFKCPPGQSEIRTAGIAEWLDVGWQGDDFVVWVLTIEGDTGTDQVYALLTGETPPEHSRYVGTAQTTTPVGFMVAHLFRGIPQ